MGVLFRFDPFYNVNCFTQGHNRILKGFATPRIGTSTFDRRIFLKRADKNIFTADGVVDICSMNFYKQQIPHSINSYVPSASEERGIDGGKKQNDGIISLIATRIRYICASAQSQQQIDRANILNKINCVFITTLSIKKVISSFISMIKCNNEKRKAYKQGLSLNLCKV